MWRHCLKEDEYYSPERHLGKCDAQRDLYYTCMKTWRASQNITEAPSDRFNEACEGFSTKLHGCMQLNMFQVERCQAEMAALKQCASDHDPLVRQALHGVNAPNQQKPWYRRWLRL